MSQTVLDRVDGVIVNRRKKDLLGELEHAQVLLLAGWQRRRLHRGDLEVQLESVAGDLETSLAGCIREGTDGTRTA